MDLAVDSKFGYNQPAIQASSSAYNLQRTRDTVLTSDLYVLFDHLSENKMLLTISSEYLVFSSTPLSSLLQTENLYQILCFLEVHVASTYYL